MDAVPSKPPTGVRLRSINGRDMEIVFHEGRVFIAYYQVSERARAAQDKYVQREKLLQSFNHSGSMSIPLRTGPDGKQFVEESDILEAMKQARFSWEVEEDEEKGW